MKQKIFIFFHNWTQPEEKVFTYMSVLSSHALTMQSAHYIKIRLRHKIYFSLDLIVQRYRWEISTFHRHCSENFFAFLQGLLAKKDFYKNQKKKLFVTNINIFVFLQQIRVSASHKIFKFNVAIDLFVTCGIKRAIKNSNYSILNDFIFVFLSLGTFDIAFWQTVAKTVATEAIVSENPIFKIR